MRANKLITPLLIAGVLAASVSTTVYADDHRGRGNGNGAIIAAGIIGAVVIGSLLANSQPQPQPVYAPPQPYYEPQPQPYYPPQQVYYQQQPQYYAPPAVYIESGYDRHYRYHHGYYRR